MPTDPPTSAPVDPLAELAVVLADRYLTYAAVGVYCLIRWHEREHGRPPTRDEVIGARPADLHAIVSALARLTRAGYVDVSGGVLASTDLAARGSAARPGGSL